MLQAFLHLLRNASASLSPPHIIRLTLCSISIRQIIFYIYIFACFRFRLFCVMFEFKPTAKRDENGKIVDRRSLRT